MIVTGPVRSRTSHQFALKCFGNQAYHPIHMYMYAVYTSMAFHTGSHIMCSRDGRKNKYKEIQIKDIWLDRESNPGPLRHAQVRTIQADIHGTTTNAMINIVTFIL